MKKIKIAFVIHTLGRGGAEQALVNLVNGMDRDKFEITVCSIINTGGLQKDISQDIEIKSIINVPRFILNRNVNETGTLVKGKGKLSIPARMYAFFWRHFPKLISVIQGKKMKGYDVIVSYLEGPTSIFVANLKTEVPKISWVHVDLENERKSEIFFKNLSINKDNYYKFDKIISVSNGVKKSLENYIGVEKEIETVYNVYEDQKIIDLSEENLTTEERTLFKNDKTNLISVGRLSSQKGYDRLIEAVRSIKIEQPEMLERLNIVIIGDGEEFNNLNELIEKSELTEIINIAGFYSNPYKLIAASDAFISSSVTEGFSTVVVESVILGKHVLTTRCSGMDEILEGYSTSKIEDNSVDGIKRLIMEYLDEVNIEEFIIPAEKEHKFDKKESILNHERIFESILK